MKKNTLFLLILFGFLAHSQKLKNCSLCSTKLLLPNQLVDLSIDELRFLANDLSARKGYQFKNREIDSYFENKSWYKSIDDNNKINYSATEKSNIKILQEKTALLKKSRDKQILDLKLFKNAVMMGDTKMMLSKFKFDPKRIDLDTLKKSLKYIDLEDIHWSNKTGIYKVRIDNGNNVRVFELESNDKELTLKYGNQGGSEFKENFYPSEITVEYSYHWVFHWENDELKFVRSIEAG